MSPAIKVWVVFSFIVLFFCGQYSHASPSGGGSAVGNGGDLTSSALEEARYHLIKVLQLGGGILPSETCTELDFLNAAQKAECKNFIEVTREEILALNLSPSKTPLVLRNTPLWVNSIDGTPMLVDAKTILGPTGVIEFNSTHVKYYSPKQLLRLLTHEFGHKVNYLGRSIEDNTPTQSFPTGRQLLDAVGSAIALAAERNHLFNRETSLKDVFDCIIQSTQAMAPFPFRFGGSVLRHFTNSDRFEAYSVTLGKNPPKDLSISMSPGPGQPPILFQIEIHETSGCLQENDPLNRWTKLTLVQHDGSNQVLTSYAYPGLNPICLKEQFPLRLSYGDLIFECSYHGSYLEANLTLLSNKGVFDASQSN